MFDFNGLFVKPVEMKIIGNICAYHGTGKWIALSNYAVLIPRLELGLLSPFAFWKKVFVDLTEEEYHEFVEREYEKILPRNEELYSMCAQLSERFGLYCLSNSNFLQGKAYRKQKLYSPFRGFFLSHETGHMKPFPGAYSDLLAKTGLKAGECLFIDDSPVNIATAALLGFKTILYYRDNEGLVKKLGAMKVLENQGAIPR